MLKIQGHYRVKYSNGNFWGESKIVERQREIEMGGERQSVAENERWHR
jgi:hypothetical protein